MAAVNEEMVIDAVDLKDAPIGVVRRDEVFRRRINFRVVHVLDGYDKREIAKDYIW